MNYNSLKVGCSTKVAKVVGYSIRPYTRTDYESGDKIVSEKLFLKTRSADGAEYSINEIWKQDHDGTFITQGLWLDLDMHGNLRAESDLAKLLTTLGVSSVEDLLDREVKLKPKRNGFMCIETEQ